MIKYVKGLLRDYLDSFCITRALHWSKVSVTIDNGQHFIPQYYLIRIDTASRQPPPIDIVGNYSLHLDIECD